MELELELLKLLREVHPANDGAPAPSRVMPTSVAGWSPSAWYREEWRPVKGLQFLPEDDAPGGIAA